MKVENNRVNSTQNVESCLGLSYLIYVQLMLDAMHQRLEAAPLGCRLRAGTCRNIEINKTYIDADADY